MPSPFPGMDPYLEGYLWPDVHQALATKIRQLLVPMVRPKYVVRLEVQVVEDDEAEEEIGIMIPDIEVVHRSAAALPQRAAKPRSASAPAGEASPATLSIPVVPKIPVKVVNVHVRRASDQHLVTSIEIVSPVNKRQPGLSPYRAKRQRLIESGVHLVEIDLLRRGQRANRSRRIPACDYLLSLTRAASGITDLWPLGIRDRLPMLPIPLKKSEADVTLDLEAALTAIYDEADYDLSINYSADPPPPELAAEDRKWVRGLVKSRR